jgi:hypothetical protein
MVGGEEKKGVEGGNMIKKGEKEELNGEEKMIEEGEKKEVADRQQMCVTVADRWDIGEDFALKINVTNVAEEDICLMTVMIETLCRMKQD